MDVTRLDFGTPVLCIDSFLEADVAAEVLQECVDLKDVFCAATVFDDASSTKVDTSYRNNTVAYLDSLFGGNPSASRTLRSLRSKIWTEECKLLWHQGYTVFDTVNYSSWQEATISRYGDGAFYKRHRDTKKVEAANRLVTLVYYVNQEPAPFAGGELVIWNGKDSVELAPRHNRAVVFPSFAIHEVQPVQLADDTWGEGRFSINYWMGFR